jgi:hypothetical protein
LRNGSKIRVTTAGKEGEREKEGLGVGESGNEIHAFGTVLSLVRVPEELGSLRNPTVQNSRFSNWRCLDAAVINHPHLIGLPSKL